MLVSVFTVCMSSAMDIHDRTIGVNEWMDEVAVCSLKDTYGPRHLNLEAAPVPGTGDVKLSIFDWKRVNRIDIRFDPANRTFRVTSTDPAIVEALTAAGIYDIAVAVLTIPSSRKTGFGGVKLNNQMTNGEVFDAVAKSIVLRFPS
jgi:hypothetical protein